MSSGQQEVLRWLALLTMLVDHVGAMLVPPELATPFRAVGRIAWPLFAFLLAYNVAVRGVEPRRYLGRLALFTLLSQVPHMLAFGWRGVSIMGTLLLASLALLALRRLWANPLAALGLAVVVVLASGFVEYGLPGILLVVAFWLALILRHPFGWALACLAVAAVNLTSSLWAYALLSLPLIMLLRYLPVSLPRSGLLPWVFYPVHLLVLAGLRQLL